MVVLSDTKMAEIINWLHLSDLHLGLDHQGWIWPTVKNDFFREIRRLFKKCGPWDLVFFTGDFVQRGSSGEFEKLNIELEELWAEFKKLGCSPMLCAVPGNHDAFRPENGSAVVTALTNLWWQKPEIRKQFWNESGCDYRAVVTDSLRNYSDWISTTKIPTIETNLGLLPGDFSGTFVKGGARLGIVGLNTTFLQIAEGDFKRRLDIHVSQLREACAGDVFGWLQKQTASVLLTHHPTSWLSDDALDHFRQEIYPPARFLAHFCGHQHEPEAFEQSEGGAPPRRLRLGASLFGLEKWNGVNPQIRRHGFAAGRFVFDEQSGYEYYWPRTAIRGMHGALNFCADHYFTLGEDESVVSSFDLDFDDTPPVQPPEIARAKESTQQPPEPKEAEPDLRLLDDTDSNPNRHPQLDACPRLKITDAPQHRYVRQEEQIEFELEMQKSRCVWLVADWGSGKEGFLSACLKRLNSETKADLFYLSCDSASDLDSLELLFPQQFGFPVQTFCTLVAPLSSGYLVLDEVQPSLCSGDNMIRLQRIANAITDYCPALRIVVISRKRPELGEFRVIGIRPLDIPDVRAYLKHHPDSTSELVDPDVIEKLYDHSGGLPMHLDRMLKALKVSSLASVLETEIEGVSVHDGDNVTPRALADTISALAKSENRRSGRSFLLLKVLTVLPYGETIESLAHYLPTDPFFGGNAIQLKELDLIDVIPLQMHPSGTTSTSFAPDHAPKLLKVPRQVRDYVQTLISAEEKETIVIAGIEKFFGRGWRRGRVKLRTLSTEFRDQFGFGAGNEFALVHHLVAIGREKGDKNVVGKGIRLGLLYASHLSSVERFRDLAVVTAALIQITERDQFPVEWSRLAAYLGEGLRMGGKSIQAAAYLKEALDAPESGLSDFDRASIWLDLALAEESQSNEEAAVEAAKEVLKFAKDGTTFFIQARAVIVGLTLVGEERKKALIEIEREARKKGLSSADTIALELAAEANSPEENLRYLDRVLNEVGNSFYNRARAVVAKSLVLQEHPNVGELTQIELVALHKSYSYSYAQRISSIFDRCHHALWSVYESRDNTPQLLRLFRHSSFLWRIRGAENKEATYFRLLKGKNIEETKSNMARTLVVEIQYFRKRLKLLFVSQGGEKTGQTTE